MRSPAWLGGLMMAAALLAPLPAAAHKSSVIARNVTATNVVAASPYAVPARAFPFSSLSYAPFIRGQHPGRDRPTAAQIRADLKILAPHTSTVRIYTPIDGLGQIVPIAAELGLQVLLGIWLGDDDHNDRQIAAALDLMQRHPGTVTALLVGNETTLGAEDPTAVVHRLIDLVGRIRPLSPVPVTTAEFWHIWRDHPELVEATDFIAAHILPYWENVAAENAVDYAFGIHRKLQRAYPGRRILVAEFGWPSDGYRGKTDGQIEQARVLRDFAARAAAEGVEYNLIESIDQPWKTHEGPVGPHWGMFDADRRPKLVIEDLGS